MENIIYYLINLLINFFNNINKITNSEIRRPLNSILLLIYIFRINIYILRHFNILLLSLNNI